MPEDQTSPRVTIKAVVEVVLENGSRGEAYVGGLCVDGLELYTAEEMIKGTPLFLTFHLTFEGIEYAESAEGKVVWSSPFFRNSFISGVTFNGPITETGHRHLLQFIRQGKQTDDALPSGRLSSHEEGRAQASS